MMSRSTHFRRKSALYFSPAGENMAHVRIVGPGYNDTPASQAIASFLADGNRWTLDHIAQQDWPTCPRCKNEAASE